VEPGRAFDRRRTAHAFARPGRARSPRVLAPRCKCRSHPSWPFGLHAAGTDRAESPTGPAPARDRARSRSSLRPDADPRPRAEGAVASRKPLASTASLTQEAARALPTASTFAAHAGLGEPRLAPQRQRQLVGGRTASCDRRRSPRCTDRRTACSTPRHSKEHSGMRVRWYWIERRPAFATSTTTPSCGASDATRPRCPGSPSGEPGYPTQRCRRRGRRTSIAELSERGRPKIDSRRAHPEKSLASISPALPRGGKPARYDETRSRRRGLPLRRSSVWQSDSVTRRAFVKAIGAQPERERRTGMMLWPPPLWARPAGFTRTDVAAARPRRAVPPRSRAGGTARLSAMSARSAGRSRSVAEGAIPCGRRAP
jgi:hypothetical protein